MTFELLTRFQTCGRVWRRGKEKKEPFRKCYCAIEGKIRPWNKAGFVSLTLNWVLFGIEVSGSETSRKGRHITRRDIASFRHSCDD